jgi:hypothetical protein
MNVTRAIIEDLLPLYAAGEASLDTRRLVEEYLATDPDLARSVQAAGALRLPPVEPPPGLEAAALRRTRKLLGEKSLLMAVAFGLGYAPMAFSLEHGALIFLMYRDLPWLAALFTVASAVAWVRFLLVCRRLQATGLQPCRGNRARALWFLAGWAAGIPAGLEIVYWTGWGTEMLVPAISSSIAIIAGERLGQISEGIPSRPTTLFGTRDEEE